MIQTGPLGLVTFHLSLVKMICHGSCQIKGQIHLEQVKEEEEVKNM